MASRILKCPKKDERGDHYAHQLRHHDGVEDVLMCNSQGLFRPASEVHPKRRNPYRGVQVKESRLCRLGLHLPNRAFVPFLKHNGLIFCRRCLKIRNRKKQCCPACRTPVKVAPGIGPYCPNKACGRADDLWRDSDRPYEPSAGVGK